MKTKRLSLPFIVVFLVSFLALALGACAPSAGRAEGWPGVAYHNGTLYTSSAGKVVAVDPYSRDQEWSRSIFELSQSSSCGSSSSPVSFYNTPIASEDLVFIGAYNGKVYALNITTGAERWIYPKEGRIGAIVGEPVVSAGTVYVCSSDGRVYALETTYGEIKWKSDPLGDKLWTSPAIEGDTIYVSTFDGQLYALSAKNGSSLPWNFGAETGFVSSPVLYGDTILVGSFDRNLYAVRISNDKFLWKFTGGNWFWAVPLVRDGIVYAGCLDGKIYALNAETGSELWEFNAQSPIVSSPILVNNSLVVACDSGKVYVLKTDVKADNRVLKEIAISASVRGPICAYEGIVYVCGRDDFLYALDINSGEVSWKHQLTVEQEL